MQFTIFSHIPSYYQLRSYLFFFFSENNTLISELPKQFESKPHFENITSTNIEDQGIINLDSNHLNPNLHSKNIKYYEFKFSSITILHIILSQMVLVLLYYDLGFIFGNVSYSLNI